MPGWWLGGAWYETTRVGGSRTLPTIPSPTSSSETTEGPFKAWLVLVGGKGSGGPTSPVLSSREGKGGSLFPPQIMTARPPWALDSHCKLSSSSPCPTQAGVGCI